MICPGCAYSNKPGVTICYMCSAPLPNTQAMKNVPKKVLLSDSRSSKLYFAIALIIIICFAYSLFSNIQKYKNALEQAEDLNIAYQLNKHKVDVLNIDNN